MDDWGFVGGVLNRDSCVNSRMVVSITLDDRLHDVMNVVRDVLVDDFSLVHNGALLSMVSRFVPVGIEAAEQLLIFIRVHVLLSDVGNVMDVISILSVLLLGI